MKRQKVLAGLLAGMLVFSNCAPTWAAEDMPVDDTIDSTVMTAQEADVQEDSDTDEADNMDAAESVDGDAGEDTDNDAVDAQQTYEDTADEEGSEGTALDLTNADADPATEEGNSAEDVDPLDENLGGDVFVDETADDVEAASDIPDAEFGMIEADEDIDGDDGMLMASGIESREEDEETVEGNDAEEDSIILFAQGDEDNYNYIDEYRLYGDGDEGTVLGEEEALDHGVWLMPGWGYNFHVSRYVENEESPYGGEEWTDITSFAITCDKDGEGQDVFGWNWNSDGSVHIQAQGEYGEGTATFTYTDAENGTHTHTFGIHIKGDDYRLDAWSDGSGMMLPGSTKELKADSRHETHTENGNEEVSPAEETQRLRYVWRVIGENAVLLDGETETAEIAVEIAKGEGAPENREQSVVLKAKKKGDVEVEVTLEVYEEPGEGEEQGTWGEVAREGYRFRVEDQYGEISPVGIRENLAPGESEDVYAAYLLYGEEGEESGEPKEHENAWFRWEYDSTQIQIDCLEDYDEETGEWTATPYDGKWFKGGKVFRITRTGIDDTELRLDAEDRSEEGNWQPIGEQSYHIIDGVRAVEDLINNLPSTVTLGDKEIVYKAYDAYERLEDLQSSIDKEFVQKLLSLYQSINDQSSVLEIREAIASLPNPAGEADEETVSTTEEQLTNLTDDQKALLDEGEYATMQSKVNAAKKQIADAKTVREIREAITLLPNPAGEADEETVSTTEEQLTNLTEDQKALLDEGEYATMQSKVNAAKKQVADAKTVREIREAITSLPNPAGEADEETVNTIEEQLTNLTEDQKALLNEDEYATMQSKVNAAKKQIADAKAVREIREAIASIPNPAGEADEETVGRIEEQLTNLTEGQKALLNEDEYATMQSTVDVAKKQVADRIAVKNVREAVAGLPNPAGVNDGEVISATEELVSSLTLDQQALLGDGEYASMQSIVDVAKKQFTGAVAEKLVGEAEEAAEAANSSLIQTDLDAAETMIAEAIAAIETARVAGVNVDGLQDRINTANTTVTEAKQTKAKNDAETAVNAAVTAANAAESNPTQENIDNAKAAISAARTAIATAETAGVDEAALQEAISKVNAAALTVVQAKQTKAKNDAETAVNAAVTAANAAKSNPTQANLDAADRALSEANTKIAEAKAAGVTDDALSTATSNLATATATVSQAKTDKQQADAQAAAQVTAKKAAEDAVAKAVTAANTAKANPTQANLDAADKALSEANKKIAEAKAAGVTDAALSTAAGNLSQASATVTQAKSDKKKADDQAAAQAKAAADAAAKKEAAKKAAEDAVAKATAAANAAKNNPTEANLKAAKDAITAANNAIAAAKAAGVDTTVMQSKVNNASSIVAKAEEAANAKKEKITISQKPSLSKVKAKGKGKATVTWKKLKKKTKKQKAIYKKIKKIQIQYSTDAAFKTNLKSLTVGKTKAKYVLKGLKKKTTYYVRIRYVAADGYSGWSKTKKVKIKK